MTTDLKTLRSSVVQSTHGYTGTELKERFKLFDHQVEGVEWAVKTEKCILAHEMGLGKTKMGILAAGLSSDKVVLVICPASLKINWRREIEMLYPEDNICIVQGGSTDIDIESTAWIIINYDVVAKYSEILEMWIKNKIIETVILDEAHYIKGKSLRAEAVLKIIDMAKRIYCLTGTPLLNRPIELFNLLRAVKHPLGKAKTAFARRYCAGQMKTLVKDITTGSQFFIDPKRAFPFRMQKHKYRVFTFMDDKGATHLDELRQATSDVILRREKKDVLDLPAKIVSEVEVELSKEHRTAYHAAWDQYLLWLESNPDVDRNLDNIKGAQQLIELGKLKQVCSLAKIPRIVADVENAVEQGNKVIIFSQYTETIRRITVALKDSIGHDEDKKARANLGVVNLTGENDAEERQWAVDQFQNDADTKVFVANIKAGGVGITLTAATLVIFADYDWSPKMNEQAEDRAHRIGQTGTVNIYYYVSKDTVEEEIMQLLRQKSEIISGILGKSELSTV